MLSKIFESRFIEPAGSLPPRSSALRGDIAFAENQSMRRVETEGDSQSSRRRRRGVVRSPLASKPHLRRLALEGLEDRTLMSTLPTPVTVSQSFVGVGMTNAPNSSSPSVAVDPLDPTKLIAAWTTFDLNNKLDGTGGQVTTYIQGAYSNNGGTSWMPLPGATGVDIQTDFSVAPVASGRQPDFSTTNNATVAFGRDQTAYLLTETSSGTGGVLDLQKWNFAGATPVQGTFTTPAYSSNFGSATINPIYRWQGAAPNDGAITPTLAVDNNANDPESLPGSPADPFSGNVYVAWETNDAAPKGVTSYNPNLLKIMSSSDGGQNFTYQAYLQSGHGTGHTYDAPKIAISQGSATVPVGQVTVVYDDAGPGEGSAPFFDIVETQSSHTGGTDYHADSPRNMPLNPITVNGGVTSVPITVNINGTTDPQFNTLQNLTVTISLSHPNLADTSAKLVAPDGTTVILWNNANPAATPPLTGTLTGANLGASTLTPYIGTTLDSTAFRSLSGDGAAPYTGHFEPFQNLGVFDGRAAAQLNTISPTQTWQLVITQFVAETITAPTPQPFLIGASLDFTSGLSDVTNGTQHTVGTSYLNSGTHTYTDGVQAVPVLPGASIASDNTLGANSPHQGRLYIALTNDNYVAATGANTTSTFIQLYYSDNGGASWTGGGIVNDDNGLTDGFSTGGYAQGNSGVGSTNPGLAFGGGEANVRPKLEPQVAVDPDTGTLVVSFLDTRNDASALRVANYIAVSTDGGASFAPETYANASQTTVDAITGATVNLGPIPDNESSGGNNQETTLGFGQSQGLAVLDGKIIPVWSSNANAGSALRNTKVPLHIESALLTFAAGPRVLSSTQGPVGQPGDTVNIGRLGDGTPIANTIQITFDRAVDPASFPADGNTLGSSPLQVFYNNPGGTTVAAPVELKVLTVTPSAGDTVYTITFAPPAGVTLPGEGVGSYTYTLRPLVKGMIPYQAIVSNTPTTFTGNFLDQNNNGTPGQNPGDDYSVPTGRDSLPLIVPGPHVTSSTVNQAASLDTAVNSGQSSFTVAGHPGTYLNYVVLSATATVYQQGPVPGTTPNDLQVFLVAADGTQYLLYNTTTASSKTSPTFQISATIPIPTLPTGEPLDQKYTIKLVDNVAGEKANLTGTVQLSDAISLVNNGTLNTYNVTFDRQMQVSSFTPAQVLSVVGPTGRIDGPQTFPSTGTSRTFAYGGSFQFIPKSGTLSSTILISNTGLSVSSLTVRVAITDPTNSSLALVLVAPDGTTVPLVAAGGATGANFTNTTFSDAPGANGLTSTIGQGVAPYSLTYQPAMPLSALSGKGLDGVWTLKVTDSTAAPTPQGRLNAWSLSITPQIPEGPSTQIVSTLAISSYPDDSFKIAHLAVQLNITSTKDSDLQVSLVSPDGTITVPLILSDGGTGANFTNTILDDNATIPIGQGTAPFGLTYKPAGDALTPALGLGQLTGKSIEGTWKLLIRNPNADGSVSTLNSWSLIATPQLTVTPVNASNGGATTFRIGFPTQTLSGTYTVNLSPNILSVAPNPANLPGVTTGTPLDTNLNAGVDALRGTSTGVTSTVVYPATAVPVSIPYATASPAANGVLTSQINVPDNFAIQGDVTRNGVTTAGLTVSLNIGYYYDPDLTVTLTAPDGKTITLFAGVGKGSNTANFTNTTLSDVITPVAPISAAQAPFFGTFNPMGPLAGFATDTASPPGQAFSQGLWTLTINNAGQDPGSSVDAAHPPVLLSWSLAFQKPQTSTGLGEPVADRASASFRLFNLAPANPLANDTWTAVGPAGTSNGLGGPGANLGGPVSVVALDPSDPSGNTAYIGASSGGVWKTTDFLTTSPAGPTYIPLTDFGSNYSINIGSIAVFGRNNDPTQSIVFAGTGDGQATTANSGNAVQGVGILRSTNGGASFTLLDSSMNVYPSTYPSVYPNGTAVPPNLVGTPLPATLVGTPLPIDSPFRDHIFVGTTTYKMIVDPTALPGGGVIVYAALGGANGGLWRSVDGGNDWSLLKAGTATDVLLDPYSASASTGNLDILYAGFEGLGVFISTNRGASLSLMTGTAGVTNLIQNSEVSPATPLRVNNVNTPNGSNGRIILAKPALTNNAAENELYQDWLYVAVEGAPNSSGGSGTFDGLFVTKDRGENWTKVSIPTLPTPGGTGLVTQALPVNYAATTNQYDVTAAVTKSHDGNSAFSMTIDPSNPNIVYLGGTHDFQTSGLIRLDLTGLYDANALVPFANNLNDTGKLTEDSTGRINVNAVNFPGPFYTGGGSSSYLNLRHNPLDPFSANSTLFVYNSSAFTNDGTGVVWTPLNESPLDGSTNIHQLLTIVDPLTGLTRLIVADDQGVFSGVYNADGTLSTSGLGTAPTVTGSLNGNLQDEAIYFSAAQPSTLAAQAAGALFYGSGIGLTDVRSSANLLSTGDLTWSVAGTTYGDVQGVIQSDNRGGTGIATDSTGGVSATSPNGNPAVYEFDIPSLGGDYTNFFRVNTNGSTTGLVLANYTAEWPTNGAQYKGVIELGNFTVNPINGSQALISSNLGNLYETTTKGGAWLQIGSGSGNFDGTYAPALTYGAPDPNAPNGIGNLNNFIYAGTVGGHIYVTQNGAGPWTSLSGGLDGSSIVSIFTNPNRGSHEAYAVTLKGVYYMANSIASASNPTPTWVNITGNLAQIQHNAFGSPALAENALLNYNNGQLGGFRSIVADYRYAVPDPVVPTTTHPVLYVAGYGGVFRSLDNGQTWTAFPNVAFDAAPADGGYLPNVDVTSLQLNLGAVNPATGHASQAPGDPEVLLASTLGRGDFAIRLAPDVFPTTVGLDPTLPAPGGSQTGTSNGIPLTNIVHPFIAGTSEISNFGNVVTITLIDEADGLVIGTGTTDTFGHFSVQVGSLANDPSFGLDGVKNVGVQATDTSGARGNVTVFTYVLKTTVPPPAPTGLTLDPTTNSGLDKSQNITNFTHPLFDVTGVLPNDFLELFRSIGTSNPIQVGTAAVGATKILDAAGVPADGAYLYQVVQVNATADVSPFSPGVVVTVNTKLPAVPTLTLFPADDSGLPTHPDVTNVRTPRFVGSGTPGLGITILSVTGTNFAQGTTIASAVVAADGTYLAQVTTALPDKVYTLVARTINAAGNISYSPVLTVTIKANGPQILPTLSLFGPDDTGLKGDGVTANRRPRFVGTTDPGVGVTLYSLTNGVLSGPLATTTSSTINGTFQIQLPFQLSNGNTQLVAQASDIAGNKGSLSQALKLRIITVAGDYTNAGAAQLTVFQPTSEIYYVLGVGAFQADTTPGRDVPVQYDLNGDGKVDPVAYRFNTAEYFGPLSTGAIVDFQFGNGGLSLPASGYYDSSGTFDYGLYNPTTSLWAILLPRPGGEVINWGVPNVDIPVPAAYDGNGVTEIATFRPSAVRGNDADSFNVLAPNFSNNYQVSFTDPTVPALKGFTYKAGDIPAPADYDGVGRDEFAIYRPTTGQFFILNVPNLFNKSTWTLRTVTMNLPGGPKVGDEPASEDYEGTGKASPTVYRPSNATFYEIQTTNGIQQAIPFGQPGVSVAAAGPLIYRLSALLGPFATNAGYNGGGIASAITPGSGPHAEALATTTAGGSTAGGVSSAILPGSSTIALAMATAVVNVAPTAPTPVPTAPTPVTPVSIPLVFTRVTAPAVALPVSNHPVKIGATTPKAAAKTHVTSKPVAHPVAVKKSSEPAKPAHKAAAPAKPVKVVASAHQTKPNPHAVQLHAAASVNLGPIKKGRKEA
jgi:subtilisin-like proprotein convertase family protein